MLRRNDIYNGLLELVKTAYPFKEASRRPKTWQACSNKPAVFLEENNEVADSSVRGAIKWVLDVNIIIYTQVGNNANATPFEELNNIIDAVIDLWASKNNLNGIQKINGLVESSYISGSIEKYGNSSDMTGAIAIIPVQLVVANR